MNPIRTLPEKKTRTCLKKKLLTLQKCLDWLTCQAD